MCFFFLSPYADSVLIVSFFGLVFVYTWLVLYSDLVGLKGGCRRMTATQNGVCFLLAEPR
jgi:hypothetical protein